jgi:hypothetical protein
MAKIHPTVKNLLIEIEAYCARSQITPTGFGKRAMNDPNFVHRLRDGRIPGITTIERINTYIARNPKAVVK